MPNLTLIIISLFISLTLQVMAKESIFGFDTAKRKLYRNVYQNWGETFYCSCNWYNKKIDLQSCGLQSYFPKKQHKRSSRTEAEHIIPASWILKVDGKYRQCVVDAKKEGEIARKYCRKHDKSYKQAHNDLVNLYPSVGAVNAYRSNKPFFDLAYNKSKNYGRCNIAISSRVIVPPSHKKGDIARIATYMRKKYGVTYSKRQRLLFDEWNVLDPISKEEVELNIHVIKAQGYGLFE